MTENQIRTRAKHLGLMLRRDGKGAYLLTDLSNALVAPGPMTLIEAELWIAELEQKEVDKC